MTNISECELSDGSRREAADQHLDGRVATTSLSGGASRSIRLLERDYVDRDWIFWL